MMDTLDDPSFAYASACIDFVIDVACADSYSAYISSKVAKKDPLALDNLEKINDMMWSEIYADRI